MRTRALRTMVIVLLILVCTVLAALANVYIFKQYGPMMNTALESTEVIVVKGDDDQSAKVANLPDSNLR